MQPVSEALLHFAWKHALFEASNLFATSGEKITIMDRGVANHNEGPDFLNARIQVGNIELAGHVEIHVASNHWLSHNHDANKHYNNVVLHVVYEDNGWTGNVPVLELKNRLPENILDTYNALLGSKTAIPCSDYFFLPDEIQLIQWTDRLLTERLEEKTNKVFVHLQECSNDFNRVLHQMIARYIAGPVNADSFEAIIQNCPPFFFEKNSGNGFTAEALLMGLADLFNENSTDDYETQLAKEFRYLCTKHDLTKQRFPVKFLRMMPNGFPTLRLSQLANLFSQQHLTIEQLLVNDVRSMIGLFHISAATYWHSHYQFGVGLIGKSASKFIGVNLASSIVMNAILPILYAYAHRHDNTSLKEKVLQMYRDLPAEKNAITAHWRKLHVPIATAYESQALIQQFTVYCKKIQCLNCMVGLKILNRAQ